MKKNDDFHPVIPPEQKLPELSLGVILLGCVLAMILGAANAYLGLFAGMTVSASIPAAVIAMGVLSLFGGNILQNNAVQTAASAGESLAAGVIFTLPALILLGTWTEFSYFETTLIALFGGLLGVLFTIPLRRALIVERPLLFPEGVATAEVLKVGSKLGNNPTELPAASLPSKGGSGIQWVIWGGIMGAAFKFLGNAVHLVSEVVQWAKHVGGSIAYFGTNASPALVAVGYIVKFNIALIIFLGGAVNWFIAIPIAAAGQETGAGSAIDAAFGIWSAETRYLGVGAMLVGGLWALISLAGPLKAGIQSSIAAYKSDTANEQTRTEQDLPMKLVLMMSGLAIVPLFALFQYLTGDFAVSAFMSVFVVAAGFLFSAVAAYMAGLVGSSNNPISGVTIATILVSSLILLAFGLESKAGAAAAILIGGVVCCAAAIGGDNMQDLKAGHIVGSTPYKQQLMQFVGVISAAAVIAPVLNLLHNAHGIGSKALSAPQAALMKGVSQGVFEGGLPWAMVAIGGGLAVLVIMVDQLLKAKGKSFRAPVMAFAVGIYLPLELSVPILLGGIIAKIASASGNSNSERQGLLLSAGIITGEALMGIGLAIPVVLGYEFLHVGGSLGLKNILATILLAIVCYTIFRATASTGNGSQHPQTPEE